MEQQSETNINDELVSAAKVLQKDLATIDLFSRQSSHAHFELIVLKNEEIIIRIDANTNHGRAHIHIDYGTKRHAASYAIDSGERLTKKATPYDNAIKSWVLANNDNLNLVWIDIRDKGVDEIVLAHLKGSNFG